MRGGAPGTVRRSYAPVHRQEGSPPHLMGFIRRKPETMPAAMARLAPLVLVLLLTASGSLAAKSLYDLAAVDIDGNLVSLSQYRGKVRRQVPRARGRAETPRL